jgi:hypothetical protein
MAEINGMRRLRTQANSAKVAAIDAAERTIGPAQPASSKLAANRTCASHDVEIQGSPALVNE